MVTAFQSAHKVNLYQELTSMIRLSKFLNCYIATTLIIAINSALELSKNLPMLRGESDNLEYNELLLQKILKTIIILWCVIRIISGLDGVASSKVDRK